MLRGGRGRPLNSYEVEACDDDEVLLAQAHRLAGGMQDLAQLGRRFGLATLPGRDHLLRRVGQRAEELDVRLHRGAVLVAKIRDFAKSKSTTSSLKVLSHLGMEVPRSLARLFMQATAVMSECFLVFIKKTWMHEANCLQAARENFKFKPSSTHMLSLPKMSRKLSNAKPRAVMVWTAHALNPAVRVAAVGPSTKMMSWSRGRPARGFY